jgi:hypothetical protein
METIDEEFFEARLVVKTPAYMVSLLEDAQFPVDAYFDAELVKTARAEKEQMQGTDEVKPIEEAGGNEEFI